MLETKVQDHEIPYFGGCPDCGRTDGYVNVSTSHWFFCDQHKTRWCAGVNLFSSWKDEDVATWRKNARRLDGYREVTPIHPPAEEIKEGLCIVGQASNDDGPWA